ncbi:unnamed protein product [Diatraea saccharalis]|uniref:Uncharacterized protein n=1 Tax=Diatraea saccharalis TaxID=40085 RepID=A0A9N9N4D5_9NEOP|nr:unnamed protein product [Diatraea saccharalis]
MDAIFEKVGSAYESVSTERQFLSDFVVANEKSAGGRLARWLSPASFVEPDNCELKPPSTPARPASRVNLPVIIRDQYGEPVVAPALKVEVVVQRIEDVSSRSGGLPQDGTYCNLPNVPYQPTFRDNMCFHAITMMKAFQHLSFEELRLASGSWGESAEGDGFGTAGRVPAERLPVRAQPDGTYLAAWTPRAPGSYVFRCTLDDHPAPKDVTVDMNEDPSVEVEEQEVQTGGSGCPSSMPASKVRKFCARYSAGLRVRASPSLQAEEVGRVPLAANLAYVEEVVNKDGTWVRLSEESVRAYTDNCTEVAWCLQHNRHLDRTLLVPVEQCASPQSEYTGLWSGYGDAQGDMQSWTQEDDIDIVTSEISPFDRRYPSGSHSDLLNEGDPSSFPYVYGLEPSKRSRIMRSESTSMPTPRRVRRSNGNSEDFWSPVKHRSSDNVRDSNIILEAS